MLSLMSLAFSFFTSAECLSYVDVKCCLICGVTQDVNDSLCSASDSSFEDDAQFRMPLATIHVRSFGLPSTTIPESTRAKKEKVEHITSDIVKWRVA